jgi:hypothetical protein
LERIDVWVDGVMIYRGTAPSADEPIARLDLSPGDHTVRAEALASFRSTPFGDESCPVKLTLLEGLRVGETADIELRVRARGIARGFSERLGLSLRSDGAVRVAHRAVPHQRHDVALPDSPVASLEALHARLERAREASDVAQVICYESKVEEVQTLMRMRERRRELIGRDPDNARYHREMIAVIDGAIAKTYGASNPCAGDSGGYVTALVQGPDASAEACTAMFNELRE